MHFLGMSGMPRRIPDYTGAYAYWNQIASLGYVIMAAGLVIFFINLFWSLMAGRKAEANPWGEGATTLEWTRSEEHTSELQSLMRISYAVFCLNNKTDKHT